MREKEGERGREGERERERERILFNAVCLYAFINYILI